MSFIRRPLASFSLVLFGLLALSGSGSMVDPGILLMVLGGLVVASLIVTLGRTPSYAVARPLARTPVRAVSDAEDLSRMDSDKG